MTSNPVPNDWIMPPVLPESRQFRRSKYFSKEGCNPKSQMKPRGGGSGADGMQAPANTMAWISLEPEMQLESLRRHKAQK